MKTNDVMELVNSSKVLPVEFNKCIEDCEMRYEEGMRTYIISASKDDIDCIVFKTEERDFSEYNKSIEKPIWLNDKTGLYELKWSELDATYGKTEYEIWEDVDSDIYNFKLIDNSKIELFNRYKESGSELIYVLWLENEILNSIKRCK